MSYLRPDEFDADEFDGFDYAYDDMEMEIDEDDGLTEDELWDEIDDELDDEFDEWEDEEDEDLYESYRYPDDPFDEDY